MNNSNQTFIINTGGGAAAGAGGTGNTLIYTSNYGSAMNAVYVNIGLPTTYNFSAGTAGAWYYKPNPLEIKKSQILTKINDLTKSCLDILVKDEFNLPSDEELFNTVVRMLKQKVFV